MAFVKLDCGILQSTIWFDRPAREVFLTALLLAEPAVYDTPQAQLQVDKLEPTGWSAPPGWYGFVPACGAAIVARAMVDAKEGTDALERLGSPELTSRSPEFGGRRLIRIDGGYLVLNYMKHRDKDHTTAQRSKRYRDRQASLRDGVASPRVDTQTGPPGVASPRDITQAEAEAEAEAEEILRSDSANAAKPKRSKRQLPKDFQPDLTALELANKLNVVLATELPSFRDHHQGRGNTMLDWQAAMRTWIRNAAKFRRHAPPFAKPATSVAKKVPFLP